MDANGHPQNIYCRSDHYEYARYGIPIVFFTTGGHSDYHQVTDEPQYIDYDRMAQVATLVTMPRSEGGEPRPPGGRGQAEAGSEGPLRPVGPTLRASQNGQPTPAAHFFSGCILGHAFPSASARLRTECVHLVGQSGSVVEQRGKHRARSELGRAGELRPVDGGDTGDAERRGAGRAEPSAGDAHASDALSQRYVVDVVDPRAGFVMTTWQASLSREGVPELRYRTRFVARFVDDWRCTSAAFRSTLGARRRGRRRLRLGAARFARQRSARQAGQEVASLQRALNGSAKRLDLPALALPRQIRVPRHLARAVHAARRAVDQLDLQHEIQVGDEVVIAQPHPAR